MDADRVREIYDDMLNARLERLSSVLDERIDFLSHGPTDVFPYLGRRRGRSEVLEALSEVQGNLQVASLIDQ
ncbi:MULTISPECIES: hypothetical protein [unclassified Bradyrhizobium]|uniref:hypothetical protein n=1 Tax=unclassified Bradyrhizobium TaxID=2631580 RepID=UPI003395EC65